MIDKFHIKDSIPYKCSNMHFVRNPYNHENLYVSCGHCECCRHNASSIQSQRIQSELKCHNFNLFFTLTYDNDHVPLLCRASDNLNPLEFDNFKEAYCLPDFDYSTSYIPCSRRDYDLTCESASNLRSVQGIPDHFAYLSKRDVQLFLKRFRKQFSKYGFKQTGSDTEQYKLRYYIVGEYGPHTERPHYHGFFFLDTLEQYTTAERLIHQTWKMCSKDCISIERVSSDVSVSHYISSYATTSNLLSRISQIKQFRPFHLCSQNPIIGLLAFDFHKVLQSVIERSYGYTESSIKSGGFSEVFRRYPSSLLRYIFPKCSQFASLPKFVKRQIYSKRLSVDERLTYDGLPIGYSYTDSDLDYFRSIPLNVLCAGRCSYFCKLFGISVNYYMELLEQYYSDCDYRNLIQMYHDMSSQSLVQQISNYPIFLHNLPKFCDNPSQVDSQLSYFHLSYDDVYFNNHLMFHNLDYVNDAKFIYYRDNIIRMDNNILISKKFHNDKSLCDKFNINYIQ